MQVKREEIELDKSKLVDAMLFGTLQLLEDFD